MYVRSTVSPTVVPLDSPGNGVDARAISSGSPAAASSKEATSTRLSGPAQLMSKLSQLRDSAPARFSDVVSGVAADLRDAAAQDSGISAKRLTALASRLDDIASGGSIAPLEGSTAPLAQAGRTVTRSAAAQAYRANASLPASPGDGERAALAKVLDDLDAALKTTTSIER